MRKTLIVSLVSLGSLAMASAESLIQNGTFKKPLAPWKVFSLKETPATDKTIEDGVLTIKAAGASDKPGNRQVSQDVKLEAGKTYSLSFDVKGQVEPGTEVVVVVVSEPGKFAFFKKVPVSAEWATQKMKVTPKELAEGKTPMFKFLLGKVKGEVCFRNVSLEPAQ